MLDVIKDLKSIHPRFDTWEAFSIDRLFFRHGIRPVKIKLNSKLRALLTLIAILKPFTTQIRVPSYAGAYWSMLSQRERLLTTRLSTIAPTIKAIWKQEPSLRNSCNDTKSHKNDNSFYSELASLIHEANQRFILTPRKDEIYPYCSVDCLWGGCFEGCAFRPSEAQASKKNKKQLGLSRKNHTSSDLWSHGVSHPKETGPEEELLLHWSQKWKEY